MSWVFEQNLNPTQKIILMALADHADDMGKCWPGLQGISEKCNLHISTIQRNIHKLEEDGFIKITERKRPNGSQTSNLYQLNLGGVANCDQEGSTGATPRTVTLTNSIKASQISDDFEVTPEMMEWLMKNRSDLSDQFQFITDQFVDYWKSKGEARKDWVAGWRNWMRKQNKEKTNVRSFKARSKSADPNEIRERFRRAAGIEANTDQDQPDASERTHKLLANEKTTRN